MSLNIWFYPCSLSYLVLALGIGDVRVLKALLLAIERRRIMETDFERAVFETLRQEVQRCDWKQTWHHHSESRTGDAVWNYTLYAKPGRRLRISHTSYTSSGCEEFGYQDTVSEADARDISWNDFLATSYWDSRRGKQRSIAKLLRDFIDDEFYLRVELIAPNFAWPAVVGQALGASDNKAKAN